MSQLTVTRGSTSGKKVTLSASQSYLIGSSSQAALVVEGTGIAARHLVVKALKAGGFGVKGLAGAFQLNGRQVEAAKLSDGDRIVIGDIEILYAKSGAEPHRQLGGFRLISTLGKGGMGTVYRAEQISLNREVALKVLSKKLTKDPAFIARFQAEARAAARLHHPNVVQVFDVDHEEDTYFYSMELMHKGSLEDMISRQGRVEAEQAAMMISEAAQGLSYAESLRIVHRDIKPDNLMLDQHGHVKIADLGLAQSDDAGSGKLQGTPHFMSPEQVLRKPLDHRSDLYALGCTFYRLVTGEAPFRRSSVKEILMAQVKEQATPANKLEPEVPAEIGEVIDRLMAKDPKERYQSADDLIEDLESLLEPVARKGILYVVTGVALLAAFGAVAYVMNLEEPEPEIRNHFTTDPNTGIVAARERETAAENAVLRLQLQGLVGVAKAAALESMAREHAGTKAAAAAIEEAGKLRKDHIDRQAAMALRRQKIAATSATLRTGFDAAMQTRDLIAAAKAIDIETLPADLQTVSEITALIATLQARLQSAAQSRARQLLTDINQAIQLKNIAALRATIDRAEASLIPVTGWAFLLLKDSGALQKAHATAKQRLGALIKTASDARENAAWLALREVMMAKDGVVERIVALELAQAIVLLRGISPTDTTLLTAQKANHLVDALSAADKFRRRYAKAITDGQITLSLGAEQTPRQVLAIEHGPSGISFRLGNGRGSKREETVALATLMPRMQQIFSIVDAPDDALSRHAFLAVLGLAIELQSAERYLARLDKNNMDAARVKFSSLAPNLQPTTDFLSSQALPWTGFLASELRVSKKISVGLAAFSSGQLLNAERLVTDLLAENADFLVVRSLL